MSLKAHERAIALTGITGLRHRLEHVELPTQEHIEMAANMGIIFSVRPFYECQWGGRGKMYEKRLGENYKRTNPFREIIDGGVLACGGTDSDVCKANIIYGIHAAVNHPVKKHRIKVEEAIEMFTCNGAYAIGKEKEKGLLKEGYIADIVVLDGDILKTDTNKIKNLSVRFTIKSGEVVYHA
jgi:predicted amidohydrolase YtcJ